MAGEYVAHLAPFEGGSQRPVVSVTGDGELHPVAPVTAVPPGLARAWASRPRRAHAVWCVETADGIVRTFSRVSLESEPSAYMHALAREYLQHHGYTLVGPPD